ncbi:MAG: 4Fe-4S binding protein [Nisaea sp.]|uniref:4Fe-4S binding protein n=1 Tax=Nisaea sp. TaxID=2024842 RepID=UPI001B229442|nr:4Fe-4S binding protein [Nisaea sp.]MBO6562186.1 4Fe-4S binding protein [Nisaea sp.]
MATDNGRLLMCNCNGSMPLDASVAALSKDGETPFIHSALCRAQLGNFRDAAAAGGPLTVCCTQEAPLFTEVAAEQNGEEETLSFVNIRERAGWSEEPTKAGPKIAALIAEAAVNGAPTTQVPLTSEGVCLVYGKDQAALDAARQLAARLDVTLLLKESDGIIPPAVMDVPVFQGRIARAQGHLGAFEIAVDRYAPADPASRDGFRFERPQDGAMSTCDLILDLTGETPLFTGHEKRDGYFRPDPGDPVAVQKALFELSDMVGEFAKPRYVDFHSDLCAHSRSRKTGCSRCIDVCPAGAISPDGDVVAFDPYICGGCGACNSVCPTGAAHYTFPATATLIERLTAMMQAYRDAGGRHATLFVHDSQHGGAVIDMMARFGRGLPAHVLPFAVTQTTQVGLDFLAAAFANGVGRVVLYAHPTKRDEISGLANQIGLAETVLTGLGFESGLVELLIEADPDAVETRLWSMQKTEGVTPRPFLALGGKREIMDTALAQLRLASPQPVDMIALPPGAPYGRIAVDVEACTLCLACVGACPASALQDNPDKPELSFIENNCVQCGLCQNTCPESAITLEPRLNFLTEAKSPAVMKEEEPFHCVRCNKPFAAKSSIERIVKTLAEKHPMFKSPEAARRLQMCEDCRVVDQFEGKDDPMRGGARPAIRTTEDYLGGTVSDEDESIH